MSATSILVIGLGGVLLLPVVWRVAARRFDPFEPVFFFVLAWGAMFVIRPAAMLVNGDFTSYGIDISGTLPRAMLLGLIGGVGFLLGYELRAGGTLARRLPAPRRLETRLGVTSAAVMTGLAFLALIALFRSFSDFDVLLGGRNAELGRLLHGSSTYLWNASALVVPAALVLVALALRERSLPVALGAVSVLGLALYRTVPIGSRLALLPLLGGLFVFVYLRRGTRPGLALLLVGLIAALVASWALLFYRDPESRSGLRPALESLVQQPGRPFRPLVRGQDAEMAPLLAGALHAVPRRLGYRYGGATMGDFLTRPIPRQLWSGKPQPPSERIVAAVWPGSARFLNPAFPPVVFFYWDFWIPGVIIGMAVFGIASRLLYEWFMRFRTEPTAQLVFAVGVWFAVIGARNDPVDTIVLASFLLLPLIVVSWLAGPHRRAVPHFVPRTIDVSDQ